MVGGRRYQEILNAVPEIKVWFQDWFRETLIEVCGSDEFQTAGYKQRRAG